MRCRPDFAHKSQVAFVSERYMLMCRFRERLGGDHHGEHIFFGRGQRVGARSVLPIAQGDEAECAEGTIDVAIRFSKTESYIPESLGC